MTLRERLADWISGSELSRLLMQNDQLNEVYWAQRDALCAIAACETPGANATVKRMVRIAWDALE